MARSFLATSSQHLEVASAPVTAVPLSIAVWVMISGTLTATRRIVSLSDPDGASETAFYLHSVSGQVIGRTVNAGSGAQAVSSVGIVADTWHHMCVVFSAVNARAAYLDGGNKGTNTGSITPAGIEKTLIGAREVTSTKSQFMNGRVAEVAIWNVALNDAEVLALSGGIAPPYVRPGNCVAYYPLWGLHSPEIDLCPVPQSLTLVNAPPIANHAPVTPFSARFWTPMPVIESAVDVSAPPFFRRGQLVPGDSGSLNRPLSVPYRLPV